MVPTKTLASHSEKDALGFKKLKDRVTVLVCANASGSLKLKLMVIGKSVKPRTFKHINTRNRILVTVVKFIFNTLMLVEKISNIFNARKHFKE